jgi:molecular chaperone DnaJ
MSRDWVDVDFYAMLEVAPDVEPVAIKRAYRRLAQESHPDANPGDAIAEARFKDIAYAYAVLSNPRQRGLYDQMRAGADPDLVAEAAGWAEVEDLMAAAGAVLGRHIVTPITVPLAHVVKGARLTVTIDGREDEIVDVPAGVVDGDMVRLEGRGATENGVTGDIILIVHVPRHPNFERSGDDILTRHQVRMSDLSMGMTTVVPTLHGPVTIPIAPGTRAGEQLRVAGYGVRHPDGRAGDLIVTIDASANDRMRSDATRGSFSGLLETIDQRDLDIIPTIGFPFDPGLHEAVGRVDPGPGRLMVTGEVRRGYRVKGEVIRPALVTVAYREEES